MQPSSAFQTPPLSTSRRGGVDPSQPPGSIFSRNIGEAARTSVRVFSMFGSMTSTGNPTDLSRANDVSSECNPSDMTNVNENGIAPPGDNEALAVEVEIPVSEPPEQNEEIERAAADNPEVSASEAEVEQPQAERFNPTTNKDLATLRIRRCPTSFYTPENQYGGNDIIADTSCLLSVTDCNSQRKEYGLIWGKVSPKVLELSEDGTLVSVDRDDNIYTVIHGCHKMPFACLATCGTAIAIPYTTAVPSTPCILCLLGSSVGIALLTLTDTAIVCGAPESEYVSQEEYQNRMEQARRDFYRQQGREDVTDNPRIPEQLNM
jgi:hypothetical protein